MTEMIVIGPNPDPVAQKYRQLLYVLNWMEKFNEGIEVFEANDELALPQRFVGRNAAVQYNADRKCWEGIEITTGEDL